MENKNKRYCFEMDDSDIVMSGSELAELSKKRGYASLREFLNNNNLWSSTIEEAENLLKNQNNI